MRILTIVLALALFLPIAAAQPPVVSSAWYLAWTNDNPTGAILGSKLYLSRDPNTPASPATLVAEIPGEGEGVEGDRLIKWPIETNSGTWYARVSFTYTSPAGTEETPVTDDLEFIVISGATGLTVLAPLP